MSEPYQAPSQSPSRRGGANRRADVPATKIFHVRLTPAEEAGLRSVADARDMPAAALVRLWIQRRGSLDALVEELDALIERADPEEIAAAEELVREARSRVRRPAPPPVEILRRRAG